MQAGVRVVVQARMGSSRLPGKIMLPLGGRPMLALLIDRLKAAGRISQRPWEVAVATTSRAEDDVTEQLCESLGVRCFRGSADNVLARYLAATDDLPPEHLVVRATGDNPLYCPLRTAGIVACHENSAADYTCVTNLSYVVPEVMRVGALRSMSRVAGDSYCTEHVTPYFRRLPNAFEVLQLAEDWRGLRPEIRLTVDTQEEYQQMVQLLKGHPSTGEAPTLEQVYARCEALQPNLVAT